MTTTTEIPYKVLIRRPSTKQDFIRENDELWPFIIEQVCNTKDGFSVTNYNILLTDGKASFVEIE